MSGASPRWSVLDLGCNAGFYSFELAKRGARVTAIDVEPLYLNQARWAAEVYGLADRVSFHELGVYDAPKLEQASWDLVWFMGVFYHLRHPLLALDILAERTRKLMVFQTLTMPGDTVYEDTQDHPIDEREPMLDPRLAEDGLHRAPVRGRPDELVGAEPCVLRGDAAFERLARGCAAGGRDLFVRAAGRGFAGFVGWR